MSNQGFCENNYVQNLSLSKDFLKFYNRNFISTIFRIKEFLTLLKDKILNIIHIGPKNQLV